MKADAARHGNGEVDGRVDGVDVDCCNDDGIALTRLGWFTPRASGARYTLKRLDRKTLGVGSGTRQATGALVFRPRPWSARGSEELTTRFSRRFDVGMVDKSCFAKVNTMYKRKAQEVQPQNVARKDGTTPGGNVFWKDDILKKEAELLKGRKPGLWDKWLIPRFATTAPGSRLTEERKKTIQIGEKLRPQERELLFACLQNREMALAWDRSEMGHIRKEVTPPMKIDTVDHKPWQAPSFAVPKALKKIVDEMLLDRLRNGTLEPCHGPYRNYWFIVEKKDKKYRLINSATRMNKVTIKDAHLPPVPDEFAEEFAGMQIGSYLDWYSGYDQVELDRLCRDMTAIMTDLGLLRQCTILMGATNSVAQFCRVVLRILQDLIPDIAIPFLDDIGVKGPRSRYNDAEAPELPGIRKFVLEHIQNLDRTLADLFPPSSRCFVWPG